MSVIKESNPEKNRLKQEAALRAAALIRGGETVGLGTGSTTAFAVAELARRKREEGLSIRCVATSFQTESAAVSLGLSVLPLYSVDRIDKSIDGCDEIDSEMRLIKGGGGAHTKEKLVHAMTEQFIVIADSSKKVKRLGEKFAVPVEVIPPSLSFVRRRLLELGATEAKLRLSVNRDGPEITENGNFILDARFLITDPEGLEREINLIPGVLENGIFTRGSALPSLAILAGDGGLEILDGRKGDTRSH